jgi:hypothetical protein
MYKDELIQVLKYILDVSEGCIDLYEADHDKLTRIHDIAAQAIGEKEWCKGMYPIKDILTPRQKKRRKKKKPVLDLDKRCFTPFGPDREI